MSVPIDGVAAEENDVGRHGPAIVRVASVVGIRPGREFASPWASGDDEVLAGLCLEVAHDVFDPGPVFGAPPTHESGSDPRGQSNL